MENLYRLFLTLTQRKDNKFSLSEPLLWMRGIGMMIQAAAIGIIAFLAIYGIAPLDPQNDFWIMAGYDESDIIQHYSGWLAYRNSDWRFPLGLADQMGVGVGSRISYTDSIPWVAIFFKLFRKFLPPVFQYFGIYTLACYILQSVGAFKILFYQTGSKAYSMSGTVLFAFAPVIMERAFRHSALGSQWLILFSIYLYFKYKEEMNGNVYIFFLLLEILAIGIHPYFLPMVFCFSFLCTYEDLCNRKVWSVGIFIVQILLVYFAGYLLGVLGSGMTVSRDGFGYYSMNLNAVINPTSCGGYNWSSLLKVHPQTLGNYDGFNYLGAGIIALCFAVWLMTVIFHTRNEICKLAKKYIALLTVMCSCTVFAVSNVVTFDDRVLFEYSLPEAVLKICGIFRASSRLFYPVYYLLFLFLCLQLWRFKENIGMRSVQMIILCIVCIQLLDIRYVVIQKHQQMHDRAACESILQDHMLTTIAQNGEFLILDGEGYEKTTLRRLAVWAHRNGLKTYFSTAMGDFSKCKALKEEEVQKIFRTQDMGKNVIAAIDREAVLKYSGLPDVSIYSYDGIYFIYKNSDTFFDNLGNRL